MTPLNHESLVKTAYELPPLPQTVLLLSDLFADPNYKLKDVERAVALDPALAGKLLRLANSSIHGTSQVGSTMDAIVRLGSGTVRAIAVAMSVRPGHDMDLSAFGLTADTYWSHCVAVLTFAEELTAQRVADFGDEFSTAALLHDFGKLVLAKHLTPEHSEALRSGDPEASATDHESRVLGVNHAEVGGVVAQSWELPRDLVRAVQYHHNPSAFDHPMCHGLNIANQLAWRLESRNNELEQESENRTASMAALGLTTTSMDRVLKEGCVRLQETMEIYT
ncbi:MAG: HDOD domain-containing protein [Fuerstiella sp.]|nr:HDOD domain-containing protein [Fuerstiella sp.]